MVPEPESDEDLSDLELRLERVESELERLSKIIIERSKTFFRNALGI